MDNKPRRPDTRPDAMDRDLYICLQEMEVPHLDAYSVSYCPHCGEGLAALRESPPFHFIGQEKPVTLPPYLCLTCGLDCRRVAIAPEDV